jgi:ABC-type transport system involved in cytochrome c biogenesis permease subunit
MKRKGVAAVLSALVFPGVGQYYMGRRMRALLFLVPAAIAGLVYFNFAMDAANAVVDQVMSGSMPLDPAAIEAKMAALPTPLAVTLSEIVFVACWVGSVAEIWLAGRTR